MIRLAALALTLATPHAETAMTPEPFTIAVPDAALDDLRDRLRATRFAPAMEGADHAYGFELRYLRELVTYWADDYDWRQEEARLNAFDQFRVEIDGTLLHYVHARSPREDAISLLMLHGWPSSFVQMLDVIPLLTEPEEGPAFDVVAVSLPGYGFSGIPTEPGMSVGRMAPLMHRLMAEVLGYYGLRSSDPGVASAMALAYPLAIIGTHTGGANPFLPPELLANLTPEEERHAADARAWAQDEMTYLQLQATKPADARRGAERQPRGPPRLDRREVLTLDRQRRPDRGRHRPRRVPDQRHGLLGHRDHRRRCGSTTRASATRTAGARRRYPRAT